MQSSGLSHSSVVHGLRGHIKFRYNDEMGPEQTEDMWEDSDVNSSESDDEELDLASNHQDILAKTIHELRKIQKVWLLCDTNS